MCCLNKAVDKLHELLEDKVYACDKDGNNHRGNHDDHCAIDQFATTGPANFVYQLVVAVFGVGTYTLEKVHKSIL